VGGTNQPESVPGTILPGTILPRAPFCLGHHSASPNPADNPSFPFTLNRQQKGGWHQLVPTRIGARHQSASLNPADNPNFLFAPNQQEKGGWHQLGEMLAKGGWH